MIPELIFKFGVIVLGLGMTIAVVNAIAANIRRLRGTDKNTVYNDVNRVLILVIVFVLLGGALMAAGKFLRHVGD